MAIVLEVLELIPYQILLKAYVFKDISEWYTFSLVRSCEDHLFETFLK